MKQNTEDVYRKLASALEQIASRCEKESEEERTIRKAAWALGYIFIKDQWQQFEDFIIANEAPPTEEETGRMREHLKSKGIDPDAR
jgi:hypothetical protein